MEPSFLFFIFLFGGEGGAVPSLDFTKKTSKKECGKQYKNNINVVNLNNAKHSLGMGFVEFANFELKRSLKRGEGGGGVCCVFFLFQIPTLSPGGGV